MFIEHVGFSRFQSRNSLVFFQLIPFTLLSGLLPLRQTPQGFLCVCHFQVLINSLHFQVVKNLVHCKSSLKLLPFSTLLQLSSDPDLGTSSGEGVFWFVFLWLLPALTPLPYSLGWMSPGWMSSVQFAELVFCLLWPRHYHHFCTLQHLKYPNVV